MTLVNWERLPGETVEEFVAAMLLLRHPHGNRITPSRGDRGVDIRVANPDGYDIYQVKRFSWMDRDHLDGMAADHPALIAYYFGDGGERIQHLMAQALQGGRDMPDPGQAPAESLLTAAIERYEGLAVALTDVDPFYRYEFDVREGRVSEQPWDGDVLGDDLTAFVRYLQLNERHYLVMRLVARAVESFSLRPITGSLELQVPVDSAERQAVEEFLHYGAPFADIDGTITHSSGPPGLPVESGPGRLSFMVAAGAADDRPDLEVRLVAADGTVLHALDLVQVRASRGVDGPGIWLAGQDPGGLLHLQVLVNAGDRDTFRLQVDLDDLVGKTPAEVLPAMRLLAALAPDTALLLAVRGGPAYSPRWQPEASSLALHARRQLRVLEALQVIQSHSYQRIVIPAPSSTSNEELAGIIQLAHLLQGAQIDATWPQVDFPIPANAGPPPEGEFSVAILHELNARVGGRQIPLGMYQCVTYLAARIAAPAEAAAAQTGDSIRLLPGSTDRALITVVSAAEALAALAARDGAPPTG